MEEKDKGYYFEADYEKGYSSVVLTNREDEIQKLKKQGYFLAYGVELSDNIKLLLKFHH